MKPHLLISSEPLIISGNLTAICGKVVSDATWIMSVDIQCGCRYSEFFNSLNSCAKCAAKLEDEIPARTYVYAIRPRSELLSGGCEVA